MGIATNGFLFGENKKNYSLEKLLEILGTYYTDVEVEKTEYKWNFSVINFKDGEDSRSMFVHYNYSSYKHEGYPELDDDYIILFSLGYGGNSIEIIQTIVSSFGGGYILENDCDDDWYLIDGILNSNPKISLVSKVMARYSISSKEATEWVNIYEKIKGVQVD